MHRVLPATIANENRHVPVIISIDAVEALNRTRTFWTGIQKVEG